MSDKKEQEVITIEEGNKPPMAEIYEGPTQPEERVQYSDKLEEVEEEADESDEIMPDVKSGFFVKKSQKFMKEALKEAKKALKENEVPVGAVIVKNGKIIAQAHNKKETKNDLTEHAEIRVIKKASKLLGDWRLQDCELYVTLEPCPMCLGAIFQSNIKKLVYGANESKMGAVESKINLPKIYKPDLTIIGGVLEDECSSILKDFFISKRE